MTNINNLKYCDALVKALLNGLHTRFATYLNLELESKHAILATISNPKFKLNFLTTSIKHYRLRLIEILKDEIKLTVNDDGIIQYESDDNDLYILEKQCISTTSHEVEIYCYLNSNAKELCKLINYKIIKKIFIKYNCILPSSAPVERMFSLETHINSAKVNRIGDKTFEYMVVLRGNMH